MKGYFVGVVHCCNYADLINNPLPELPPEIGNVTTLTYLFKDHFISNSMFIFLKLNTLTLKHSPQRLAFWPTWEVWLSYCWLQWFCWCKYLPSSTEESSNRVWSSYKFENISFWFISNHILHSIQLIHLWNQSWDFPNRNRQSQASQPFVHSIQFRLISWNMYLYDNGMKSIPSEFFDLTALTFLNFLRE